MKGFGIAILFMSASFSVVASDPDLARHLTRIEQLLSNEQYKDASNLAKALVPDNDEQKALHQRLLGFIYLQEGDLDRASLAYTNAVKYSKLPPSLRQDAFGALVSISMKRSRPDIAVRYGQLYLEEFPPFQPVEQLYTRALFAEQYYDRALEQANAVIARYADAPEFMWQIKALSEEQLFQDRALINTTRNIQERYGNDIRWQRKQAGAYARLGQLRQSLRLYQQAKEQGMALTGQDYLDMAHISAQLGKASQAAQLLSKGVTEDVALNDRETQKRQLQYLMQASQWGDAWVIAAQLNEEPELSLLKAQCRIASQLQQWPDAADLAQRAIAMGGEDDPFLWEILGYSAMKINQFDVARNAYETLKRLEPDGDADVWLKTLELLTTE
ncbi:tetratricopeptide repeat protein [Enterovibrio norvegicus]|uniref:tetratricopeptide repeat protein n=1 Tax=Enterovibrio norvegicus TaxID=188144 RepID=UPI0024B15B1E|nr:hypothetical protein [Enterovibrio norvegicus]